MFTDLEYIAYKRYLDLEEYTNLALKVNNKESIHRKSIQTLHSILRKLKTKGDFLA